MYQHDSSRRKFIKRGTFWVTAAYAGLPALNGSGIRPLNKGLASLRPIPGKHEELIILNDRPWNAETPPHLLDDLITPADKLFVRNNGLVPEIGSVENWTLEVSGESVVAPKTYTFAELRSQFPVHTYQLTIECGGNGRAEFDPPAKGNQWKVGAIGCPEWTGIRLRDILEDVGLKDDAQYVAYYGKDIHLSGDPEKVVISRGVPLHKAQENESLLAWSMNGQDIPLMNGYPLRMVIGGWPGSVSGKWIHKIVVRNREHDGPKMGGQSYRVPCIPVAPGSAVADEDMCIIESMPVKSLITAPKTGGIIREGRMLEVRGKAWAGDLAVASMEVSTDFGSTWQAAKLSSPQNRLAWQPWEAQVAFPGKGYYEVWARATDTAGHAQPMVLPGWNPRGYLNNACHRIAIKVV